LEGIRTEAEVVEHLNALTDVGTGDGREQRFVERVEQASLFHYNRYWILVEMRLVAA